MDHLVGDAGAAVQHQGNIVGSLMDALQCLEIQALPVFRVHAVNVADACGQEINAQIGDLSALLRVSDLACTHNAVFHAADRTHLGFDAQALVMCQLHQLFGFGNVFFNGIMAAVKHDGGETGLNAGLGTLVGAVIQMQGYGNRDAQAFIHGLYHGGNGFKAAHILAGAFGNTQDHRALHFFALQQNAFGPLQIVDVELGYTVMAVTGLQEHIGCVYQHNKLPTFQIQTKLFSRSIQDQYKPICK